MPPGGMFGNITVDPGPHRVKELTYPGGEVEYFSQKVIPPATECILYGRLYSIEELTPPCSQVTPKGRKQVGDRTSQVVPPGR